MSITLTISAETPDDFTYKLSALRNFAGHFETVSERASPVPTAGVASLPPELEAQVRVELEGAALADLAPGAPAAETKKRPGRPRKVDKPEPVDTLATTDEPDEADKPAPAPAPEPAREPTRDFDTAMELLRTIYTRPDAMPHVTGLLAKYDVVKFAQIPADKGTELLMDARLLDEKVPA